MTVEIKCTAEQLPRLIARRLKMLEKRVSDARKRAAEDGVPVVKMRTPKAFGELQESVHFIDGIVPKIVVDAPHAGSVEIGSRPHQPDMEALIAWVKLRGMQGLTERGNLRTRFRRDMGPTTGSQAMRVARMLSDATVAGRRGQHGRFSPVDAPKQVAEAIAAGIKAHGTPPHWYVRDSLPVIAMRTAKHIRRALGK